MSSLRLRIVALVGLSIFSALFLFAIHTRHSARVEFIVSVKRSDSLSTSTSEAAVQRVFGEGGWEALHTYLASEGFPGLIALSSQGEILPQTSPEWRGAEATFGTDGEIRLVDDRGETQSELRFSGGWLLPTESGDTLALVLAAPSRGESIPSAQGAVDTFTSALGRRLWAGAAVILLVAGAAAYLLTDRLLRPLRRLGSAARSIEAGDLSTRVGRLGSPELDAVASAFDGMATELERSEWSRRRLFRDLAHELRSPLTNLRGTLESIEDGLREPDGPTLQALRDEAMLLERLTRDLSELARFDAGMLELARRPFRVSERVDRLCERFQVAGRMSESPVSVEIEAGLEVEADPDRFDQVVGNLLENAVVHGGQEVRIRIEATGIGQWVRVRVSDDGPGIPEEERERVTERLYRIDRARDRRHRGAGLGLAIVRELVEVQGGRLTVGESETGGTAVTVELPRGDTSGP